MHQFVTQDLPIALIASKVMGMTTPVFKGLCNTAGASYQLTPDMALVC